MAYFKYLGWDENQWAIAIKVAESITGLVIIPTNLKPYHLATIKKLWEANSEQAQPGDHEGAEPGILSLIMLLEGVEVIRDEKLELGARINAEKMRLKALEGGYSRLAGNPEAHRDPNYNIKISNIRSDIETITKNLEKLNSELP